MKILINAIVLFLIGMVSSCSAQARNGATNDNEISAELGQVSVKVLVKSLPKLQPCDAASSWRWGVENACPRTIIGSVTIKAFGKPLFVPLSAFADLGNPRNVKVESRKEKESFAVILKGGDAATSYSAILEFRNNILSERVVRHGEFPDESWEKTIYKFNMSNL